MTELSYPRQRARTRGFTLGAPRGFEVSADGRRVLFLRSRGGTDPMTCLWALDVDGGERLLADPGALLGAGDGERLSEAERARRERAREQAGGVVSYATGSGGDTVAFTLGGRAWLADARSEVVRELPAATPAFDPRPDPAGTRVAYVRSGALRVLDAGDDTDRAVAEPDGDHVTWGLAEFIAAEEMRRSRGFWWSPDGSMLLAARVDAAPVQRWYVADAAHPGNPPGELAYPAAGTANADVSLWLVGLDGRRTPVEWERDGFPYVVSAHWHDRGLLLLVQSRDQRRMRVLEIDPANGTTALLREDTDPAWLEIVPGTPALTAGGALAWTADADGARRLLLDGHPVTPPDLQVRAVLDVDGDTVLLAASREPTEVHLWTYGPDGASPVTGEPGVHAGRRAGGTTVVASAYPDRDGVRVAVRRGEREVAAIPSYAETPPPRPCVSLLRSAERELRTAVALPRDHEPGSGQLPVLMSPYGGPHAQRVVARHGAYLDDQWFADQGFAVVIADGRGTPGRDPEWERAVRGDLAGPVLADQIEALHAAAERFGDLDLSRVGIRGWSFGGYLAALAVLRRPDVFHAAVAGAPVTEWRLYDTHYTERYLGHPEDEPESYEDSSLLSDAERLRRPLLLVHGLADDNVVAAHTLRLSSALLAAGRAHNVLPLSGVTHMTPQEAVAENLLRFQADFLRTSLDAARSPV